MSQIERSATFPVKNFFFWVSLRTLVAPLTRVNAFDGLELHILSTGNYDAWA